VVKFVFYHSKLRKKQFLLKFSNPAADTLLVGRKKFVPHHEKTGVISSVSIPV